MRDFSDDLKLLRGRLDEASSYLRIPANRARLSELEHEVSLPDLWDDQDEAKRITAEFANVKADIDTFDQLVRELEDTEVLHEMAREIDDETQEGDISAGITSIGAHCQGVSHFILDGDESTPAFISHYMSSIVLNRFVDEEAYPIPEAMGTFERNYHLPENDNAVRAVPGLNLTIRPQFEYDV